MKTYMFYNSDVVLNTAGTTLNHAGTTLLQVPFVYKNVYVQHLRGLAKMAAHPSIYITK